MENINCPYCGKNESSKTSFAHHVCDKDMLRQRIDGLEAHAKMWHRESLRLAAKHSEDVFYYHGSPLEDDARLDQFSRLIACWNACEGISTEALESNELQRLRALYRASVEMEQASNDLNNSIKNADVTKPGWGERQTEASQKLNQKTEVFYIVLAEARRVEDQTK